ncbi:hypothetical protein [Bacillus sp. CECT 9360]|uniref:hypothetical protein n=1 Tax=Bacillus sp. CECT 9360 TaxID=2845821 RepID=UPI001E514F32|nr:hypothetical protein [Bacillus sp. CECT 9360]
MMNQRPAEKRAGKTPQRGTSEEACQFVRGKRVDSMTILKSTMEFNRAYIKKVPL